MSGSIEKVTGRAGFKAAVALGSGLGDLASALVTEGPVSYSEIDGMPVSGVEGHAGALHWGKIEGNAVLVFAGRVHLYEGHDARTVTHWVRAAVEAGCEVIVLTNAAGGIEPAFEVGSPVVISDHLNLSGTNPLIGPNDESARPRFLDLTAVYDPELRKLALGADPTLQQGVYAGLFGPTYETPAEVKMLRTLGADLVGMSTVNEAIQARHLGARVLGISVVTNQAAGISPHPLSHDEVAAAGRQAAERLRELLRAFLARL